VGEHHHYDLSVNGYGEANNIASIAYEPGNAGKGDGGLKLKLLAYEPKNDNVGGKGDGGLKLKLLAYEPRKLE
jgi:hypothetical protein